ncbi:TcpE family conjugal transfer membrane protein [Nonomuraea dietziae]|uniref:TcpE family conjugal transfer membrane protein n=1 Tax=Nonomuraea dietziae TaxID=65515 RepID=UPI0033E846E3
MDLPTYTNIWRIEKRLYKLYDLRLPMPLPIVWIGVFVGVLAPWSLLLWLVGISFEAPWHVLYLVPPGIVTWLSTRPVIESKRLTELLQSQLRYMGEPRSWCRLTPSGEPETVVFSGRVWRAAPAPVRVKARAGARRRQAVPVADKAREVRPAVAAAAAAAGRAPVAEPATLRKGLGGATGRRRRALAPVLTPETAQGAALPQTAASEPLTRQDTASEPAAQRGTPVARQDSVSEPVVRQGAPSGTAARRVEQDVEAREEARESSRVAEAPPGSASEVASPGAVSRAEGAAREADGPRPATASRWGSRSEPSEAPTPSPAKPIGTEALRRLRRLAATADAPTPSDPDPALPADRRAVTPRHTSETTPGSVTPGSVTPDPVGPEAVPAEPDGSRPVRAEAVDPDLVRAEAAEPRPVDGEIAAPEDTRSRDIRSGAAGLEAAGPENVRSEVSAPEAAGSGDVRSEAAGLEAVRSGDVRSEASAPEAVGSGDARSGATAPEATGSGAADVESAGPEDARSQATGSEVGESEAVERVVGKAGDIVDVVQAEDQARDQHRKGQPPRTGAVVLPASPRVWPPTPSAKPATPSAKPPTPSAKPASSPTKPVSSPAKPASSSKPVTPVSKPVTPVSKPRVLPSIAQGLPTPADSQDGPAQPASPATPRPIASTPKPPPMTPPRGAPLGSAPPTDTPPRATPSRAIPPRPTPSTSTPSTSTPSKATPPASAPPAGTPSRTAAELPKGQPPPLSIRAVPTAGAPTTPANPGAAVPGPRNEARVRRVESVVGRDSSGGWRRLAQVVVGGGSSRTDGSEIDEARTRAVFGGSRRVVVLGCTGGAGQSTTALMLGHTFAHYRDDRVLAVDASTGGTTLTSRIKVDSPETLTSLLSGLDQISGYLSMRAFTTRTGSGLEVVAADTDIGAEQRLADRTLYSDHRLGQAMRLLDHHYKLAVIDPAPALAARVLPYADQLVLVVPASEDAAEAVAMTYEWLDGHGCADLRRRAVMVVNGVSRRSMNDVEQAEAVARGRCRAIVRVPWEDDLAQGGTEPVEPGRLRPAGRRAYLAMAGVVVAGFASAQSTRPSEEEVAQ